MIIEGTSGQVAGHEGRLSARTGGLRGMDAVSGIPHQRTGGRIAEVAHRGGDQEKALIGRRTGKGVEGLNCMEVSVLPAATVRRLSP